MPRLAVALLALCASTSVAIVTEPKEWTPTHHLKPTQVMCHCQNWADVYKTSSGDADKTKLMCGQGLEFVTDPQWLAGGTNGHLKNPNAKLRWETAMEFLVDSEAVSQAAKDFLWDEFCTNFYRKIRTNHCVKIASNSEMLFNKSWWGESWCYVDGICPELNGGDQISNNGDISYAVKICKPDPSIGADGDQLLGDRSPMELKKLIKEMGLATEMGGLVVKMAFPYLGENFLPHGLEAATGGTCDDAVLQAAMGISCKTLEELQARGDAIVADAGDHASDKYVIYGKSVWNWSDDVTCIHGCEER